MRKLIISLTLIFATIPIFAQFSGSGTGTANDPYLIYNENQLAQVANFLGQGGVVFKLMKDLNVSNYIEENDPSQGWQPIGVYSSPFKGTFDGNGHKISGLFINRSKAYLGFFGYADGATIKSLKIEATYIKGTGDGVGAVVGGCHNCTITDCSVVLSLSTGITARSNVGGVAGSATLGKISNCDVYGSINGQTSVGGIIGQSNVLNKPTTVTSVTYNGNITGTANVGGIIGNSCCCYISSAFFKGKIINTGDYTGGIEGRKCLGETSNSIVFGDINGVNYVGGIIGASIYNSDYENDNHNAIDNCSAIVNIFGSNYVGGIIGQDLFFTQTNNYYSGNLTGDDYVGGLAGYANQNTAESIAYCYSHATITGANRVGGLVGYIGDTKLTIKSNVAINPRISAKSYVGRIYGSYIGWNVNFGTLSTSESNRSLSQTIVKLDGVVQDVVDNLQNGTSVGPSMLKLRANYVSWGWNFDDNWNILETECYPYKKYQAAPPKIESSLVSQATSITGSSVNGGTVYLYYNDKEPVSTTCSGNSWSFSTEPLQSGSLVKIYAMTSSLKPSYFTTGTVGFSGSGATEEDPYLIYSAADLQGATNSGYYKLMNDIDLTSWINENSPSTGWPAVRQNGTEATYINGNGHKVSGLWTNTSDEYTGLFSYFSAGGYIKNLTVEVASGKKVKGGDYTGILIGRMDGQSNSQIINCSVKGDVQGTKYVGGMTGYLKSVSLTNNNFSGTVSSSGSEAYTGGLAGYVTNLFVKDCSASATVSAAGTSSCVGGLCGYINYGGIQKSYTNVTVKATGSGSKVGGITGWNNGGINSSFAKGSVTSSGDNSYTGGLSGYNTATNGNPAINNCYATTNVTGTLYTAGLVGYSCSTIDCCYATGDVNGVMYGAGVVGKLDGSSASIKNSVAANNILSLTAQSSWACRVIGGITNGAPEPDNSNYALSTMQVSLNGVPQNKTDDNLEGIAKTQEELMSAATYKSIGWSFSSIWGINNGYPFLQWFGDETVDDYINFADDNVKAICVANWDTNNDGELSMTEAAAVTDLGEVFKGNEEITSFDELQYFTGLTSIGTVAFNNCRTLTSITIPNSVTSIGQFAFNSTGLRSVVIPENLTTIGYGAFSWCALESVTIPNSVTVIEEFAFHHCFELTSVTVEWQDPLAVPENIFEDINYNNVTLYVPDGTKAAYKTADVWKVFFMDGDDREEFNVKILLRELIANMEAIGGYELDDAKTTAYGVDVTKDDIESAITQLQQQIKDRCANAGEDDLPVDATGLITNPSFTFDNNLYWLGETPLFQTWNNAEFFQTTFDIHQQLTGLPNGNYMLKVKGFHRPGYYWDVFPDYMQGTDNARAQLYANDKSVTLVNLASDALEEQIDGWCGAEVSHNGTKRYVPDTMQDAYMWFSNGYYENELPVTVTDGTLTLGIRLDESVEGGWVIFDDFRLQYLGSNSENVIEYTDISAYDNVIYVDDKEVSPDSQVKLSVKMNNTLAVRGFQFDLVLPDGITVDQDEDGLLMVELSTERTTLKKMNYFDYEKQEDGSLRVLCNSTNAYTFDGNSGEVCTITVHIGALEAGDYPVVLKNIIFTDVSAKRYPVEDAIISKISINDYTPGDVNNDGYVDVADVALVGNYILGRELGTFIFKAADTNQDNEIDVSDFAGVANIVLRGNTSYSPRMMTQSSIPDVVFMEIPSVQMMPGDKVQMPIAICNPSGKVSSFQTDIHLPDGIRIAGIETNEDRCINQFVDYEMIDNQTARVLCVSPNNSPLKGVGGNVLIVELEAANSMLPGSYLLSTDNNIFTSCGNRIVAPAITTNVEVGNATSITGLETDGILMDEIYNTNGTRISKLQRGINIVRDKKGIIHKIVKK